MPGAANPWQVLSAIAHRHLFEAAQEFSDLWQCDSADEKDDITTDNSHRQFLGRVNCDCQHQHTPSNFYSKYCRAVDCHQQAVPAFAVSWTECSGTAQKVGAYV